MVKIATLRDRIANTPGLKRDTIAVVVALTIGLICSGYVLVSQHVTSPWAKKFTFAADFTGASGVRPQAVEEVRIAGVPVGRITAASPTSSGTAQITMQIDPNQTVYQNAQLILRTKSPLNVMYVELNPGGPPAAPLGSGGVIPVSQTQRAVQPYEVLDQLDATTRASLTSLLDQGAIGIRGAQSTLPAGLDATTATMKTWEPVIKQLDERRANIARLVTAAATISQAVGHDKGRLTSLTVGLDETLQALASRDSALSQTLKALPGFSTNLENSMTHLHTLTSVLNPTLDDLNAATGVLPQAIDNLTGTVNAVHNFVDGATPVIADAGPIVTDLRPFISGLGPSLVDLKGVAGYLPSATAAIVPWMGDLAAFTYQTSSSFSLADANGGLGRADLDLSLTNPTGGLGNVGVK